MTLADDLAQQLTGARRRTLHLTDHDEAELVRTFDALMSPLVWDLAHIGQQEDLWLLRGGDGRRPGLLPPAVEALYDAFTHPRAVRDRLPLLPPVEARAFCHEVRGRVLDRLERLGPDDDPFDFAMVVSHEQQHDETMLQALQLRSGPPLLGTGTPLEFGRQLQHSVAIQGALDPELLRAGGPALSARVDELLEAWSGGPYVFNLGHGVPPDTDPDVLTRVAELVRSLG